MKKNIFLTFTFVLFFLFFIVLPSNCFAKTSLLFVPNQINKSLNEDFTFGINVQSAESVFGVDLKITYDPKVVAITKVIPGNFWINPQVIKESNDQQKGIINLSIFSLKTQLDQNNLVFFTAKIAGTGQSNSIISIDKESIVAGTNGQKIIFETTPLFITFISPTTVQNIISPTMLPLEEISLTPTLSENGPTITIKNQTTPILTTPTASSGNIIKIVAFVLLLTGILALIVLKKVG